MSDREAGPPPLTVTVPIESDDDLRALRGALLAARATELGEVQRRAQRHNLGYGTDSQRESMTEEVVLWRGGAGRCWTDSWPRSMRLWPSAGERMTLDAVSLRVDEAK